MHNDKHVSKNNKIYYMAWILLFIIARPQRHFTFMHYSESFSWLVANCGVDSRILINYRYSVFMGPGFLVTAVFNLLNNLPCIMWVRGKESSEFYLKVLMI